MLLYSSGCYRHDSPILRPADNARGLAASTILAGRILSNGKDILHVCTSYGRSLVGLEAAVRQRTKLLLFRWLAHEDGPRVCEERKRPGSRKRARDWESIKIHGDEVSYSNTHRCSAEGEVNQKEETMEVRPPIGSSRRRPTCIPDLTSNLQPHFNLTSSGT